MTRPTAPLESLAAGVFGTLARVRGDRWPHPTGIAFRATLVVDQPRLRGARVFARRGRWPAYVRFSRGFGLPEPLPELLSMAVKVPDAYGPGRDQDLLMASTGERPVLRHLFTYGRSHLAMAYSTVFPFRVGERTMLLGARRAADAAGPRGDGTDDLEELVRTARAGELAFDLRVATPLGPWRTVARLEVGEPLAKAEEDLLGFNSDHAGGGIEPVGWVNRVRGAAYAAANRGRAPERR